MLATVQKKPKNIKLYVFSGRTGKLSLDHHTWVDIGITMVILFSMKTAISIPDPVFKTAERLAKRLGLSRSELYVRAISNYVEAHKSQKVTDLLNEIYGDMENQGLEKGFRRAQMKSIDTEEW